MKKTGLNGYVYDFNTDCTDIAVDDILGIHNYSKWYSVKCLGLWSKYLFQQLCFLVVIYQV